MADLLNIAIGPGDCVCADFSDPSRLLGANLPEGLEKLLAQWSSEKPDPYADLDSDSDSDRSRQERHDESTAGKEVNGHAEREVIIQRGYTDRAADKCENEAVIRPTGRDDSRNGVAAPLPPGRSLKRDEDYDSVTGRDDYDRRRDRDDIRIREAKSRRRQIAGLAFGSRVGDYAVMYEDKGEWFLDGNVFERLSTLKDFIIPREEQSEKEGRSRIRTTWNGRHRFFLGPENTYFAWDPRTGEFSHNIQTREFRDWVDKCCGDDRRYRSGNSPTLEQDYTPHSLALGPDDMFCWISKRDFKVNLAFRKVFPGIERFLKFSRNKGILNEVSFITSSYTQPGSKLPYFILSTTSGICVSVVPQNATELVSESSTRWAAVLNAKRAREAKEAKAKEERERDRNKDDIPQADKDAAQRLRALDSKLEDAGDLANAGGRKPRGGFPSLEAIVDLITTELDNISRDCNENAIHPNSNGWREAKLSERLHRVIEGLKQKAVQNGETPEGDETITDGTKGPVGNAATEILEQIRLDLLSAAGYADPSSPLETGNLTKQLAKVTRELILIHKVCDANVNVVDDGSDEWQTATLGERVKQIVESLKKEIKPTPSTGGGTGTDEDPHPFELLAVLLDPEGDLSLIPEFKHFSAEALQTLRQTINEIKRVGESVQAVTGSDALISQMSLADQIQYVLAEMTLRGELLEKCDKSISKVIGAGENGILSLPDRVEFLVQDHTINSTDLGKINEMVSEVVAKYEDVSKLALFDKITLIIGNNAAQTEETKEIEAVLDDILGKNNYSSDATVTDRIKIIAGQRDDLGHQLAAIRDQVTAIIEHDSYYADSDLSDRIRILAAQKSNLKDALGAIEKAINEATKNDERISPMSLQDKVTTILADNLAKAQEVAKYSKMIKDIEVQVGHLKDGDVKHKLREILKRK